MTDLRREAEAVDNQLIFGTRREERLAIIEAALKAQRREEVEVLKLFIQQVIARLDVHIGNKNISEVAKADCDLYEQARTLLNMLSQRKKELE